MSEVQNFIRLLKTVPRDWRAAVDRRLQPLGLSQAKWQSLLFLYRSEGPCTQTEIAEFLDIESPTLVRQLDRLASDGWIERKSCPGDRRARHIVLTTRAKKVCAEIEAVVSEVRQQLLANVSKAELMQCIAILQKVQDTTVRLLATPLSTTTALAPKASARRVARPKAG